MRRATPMEQDPTHKQIIPYLVLRDGDRYFLMRRTRAGADRRLHDRWSIGVGGHLNPGDDGLLGGLRREWREELHADFEPAFEPLALLNDDTTDVGAVHLGVVFVADAAGRPVTVREQDKLTGSFATRRRGRGRGRRPRDVESARVRGAGGSGDTIGANRRFSVFRRLAPFVLMLPLALGALEMLAATGAAAAGGIAERFGGAVGRRRRGRRRGPDRRPASSTT